MRKFSIREQQVIQQMIKGSNLAPIIGSYISFWSSKNMVTNVKIDSCQTNSIIECLDNIGNRFESVQIRDTTDLGNQKDMIRFPQ